MLQHVSRRLYIPFFNPLPSPSIINGGLSESIVLFRYLLIGFLIFIGWVIYLTNTGQQGELISYFTDVPYADKAGHFILTGILTLLANLGLDCRYITIGRINILLGTLLISIIVFLEECTQIYIPTRTFSQWDLLSDFGGIFIFSILSIQIQKLRTTPESKRRTA